MGKNKVIQLSSAHFKMSIHLRDGYPTHKEKLNELFFDGVDAPEVKMVITKYFERIERESTKTKQAHREKTESRRMFSGRTTVMVAYPGSGQTYEGRVRYMDDLCMIEPIKPNTAFWIIERKHMEESDSIVDLNVIPSIRQIHNKAGREISSEFR